MREVAKSIRSTKDPAFLVEMDEVNEEKNVAIKKKKKSSAKGKKKTKSAKKKVSKK